MGRITEPAVFLTRALFGLLGLIIVLENLGVHLTAVWTTLGVGSVAIAMALQDTLSNFFAGLYLIADRPMTAGDYIKLDSGQEGYIVRIGWRSTLMNTIARNVIVVPNSTMAKAIVTNYSQPQPQMSIPIEVGVAYGTNSRHVVRILKEIHDEAVRDCVEGLEPEPAPRICFMPGFGDSSLNFTLYVHVRSFADSYHVLTEVRNRIMERFKEEGIEFPFPTRTIVLDKSVGELLGHNGRLTAAERMTQL